MSPETLTPTCRWLGAAGLEIRCGAHTLLVDPFFTRPALHRLLSARRLQPDRAEIAGRVSKADFILITHPHYDHLMDVPEVMRLTGARAYGSSNTCTLLAVHGRMAEQVRPGDRRQLGPFQVAIYPARHTPIPLARWFNGPLPANFAAQARLPLRATDYRMDACYSFRITFPEGQVWLVGNHPTPAEVVFLSPYYPVQHLRSILAEIQPGWVTPIHWDNFTRPLSQPLRRMLVTRAQGLSRPFPPLQPIDLEGFAALVLEELPRARVRVPELFAEMTFEG